MLDEVVCSSKVDKSTGVISDEEIRLIGIKTFKQYPENLRMVTYEDFSTDNVYRFLTNNTEYKAITISELYRERWNVDLFFKWIKQHIHIKSFYGTSENAIFLQIWIAVCTYLLFAWAKKVMHIDQSLYQPVALISAATSHPLIFHHLLRLWGINVFIIAQSSNLLIFLHR